MPRSPKQPRVDFSRPDWQREDVGRITQRTDATTRGEWRAYMTLLDLLYTENQRDVLGALIGRTPALRLVEVKAEVERTGDIGVQNLMSRLLLRKELWGVLSLAAQRLAHSQASKDRNGHTLRKLARGGVVVEGKTLVRDLLTVDWRAVRTRWTARGPNGTRRPASASDWNHARRFLSAALTDLFGGGRTGEGHPFRQQVLDRFPSEKEYEREVTLTLEQFRQLVDALPERVRPAVITLALTGIREGEYLALTPENLEPAACVIRVDGKTGPRPVHVQQEIWPVVVSAVPSPVHSASRLRYHLARAAEKIGYPDLHVHDLRHLSATAMLWAGANIGEVRDALGHADATTTMRYVKGANRASAAKAAARAFAPVLKRVGGESA